MTSRLANDESDDEPILLNNTRITTIPVEFGGLFGNLILFLSLPILVILSKIALKTVIIELHYFIFISKTNNYNTF